ncbi:MAG: hypothetical protein M1830_002367 [Pleopsidium flavum]|nr:MAG: hypothetical protein M1830_002367 [Pleopsidium flavum]
MSRRDTHRDRRDPRESRDPRDPRDPRDVRDVRDARDPRDGPDAGDPGPRRAEYFVPGDGISREVIQADICRYLGPDALIRPMDYNGVRGYMVKAYRPFTSEMIADLKQDSLRWQAERDQIDSRGYGGSSVRDPKTGPKPDKVLVDYTQSVTHQSRQFYGATGQQPPPMPPGVPVTQGGSAQAPFSYDPNYTYGQSSAGYQPPGSAYAYPSPVGTDYDLQGREPRSQAYSYGQPPAGGVANRGIPGPDPEAQAYYYATQGQQMPGAGRGQTYAQPPRMEQPQYSQPPPRESYGARDPHSARDDGGRRRRDR